jgi:hypothetical protein
MISRVTKKFALENYIKVIRKINTCRPVQSNQNDKPPELYLKKLELKSGAIQVG